MTWIYNHGSQGSILGLLAEHHTGKWPDRRVCVRVCVHTTLEGWSGGAEEKTKKGDQGEGGWGKGRKQAETQRAYICKEAQATLCHVDTRQIVSQAAEAKWSLSCFSLQALTTPSFELTPTANSDLTLPRREFHLNQQTVHNLDRNTVDGSDILSCHFNSAVLIYIIYSEKHVTWSRPLQI